MIISIFILTLAFAFDDKKPRFEFDYWITNFIYFFLTVLIVVLVYQICQKLAAYRYKVNTNYRLMSIQRFWFGPSKRNKISYPIGIILSLLITFFSKGRISWLTIGSFIIENQEYKRLGFKFAHVTEYETAKIAASGPLAATILALVFKSVGNFNEIVLISSLYAVFNLIPIGNSDGTKILFGAKYMYFFILGFVLISSILANLIGGILAGLIALFAALIIFFGILYKGLSG
ncbi:hypothetical protein HYX19_04235 [Candidatus Woesearchaeota archaeon]|nr:hypothetical protein [Candidatus Woesearchaeota archaeon]